MIGKDWGRAAAALGVAGVLGLSAPATAQQAPKAGAGQAAARGQAQPKAGAGRATVGAVDQPAAAKPGEAATPPAHVELKYMPVNPNDPVAIVNGEVITRAQLADECVARKGGEILDTMVARRILDQALKAQKLEVTQAEIYAEIDRIAATVAGTSREEWLRTLDKSKNISPAQYARDVIYPSLALRKLATPRVQITDQDVQDAFEAQFGERLEYRMIMCSRPEHAKQVWEELQKNPGSFEHLAMNDPRSMDPATRSTGGKPINGPLQRHSYPREVTDRIFRELVDGDPDDDDPKHKPKDGQISGAIQVSEDAWIIVKREAVHPAQEYDKTDKQLVEQMRAAITESKVQAEMERVFDEMLAAATIENKLNGTVKQPQAQVSKVQVDRNVRLMSSPPETAPPPQPGKVAAEAAGAALPTPAGVKAEDAEAARALKGEAPRK
jgi:foldase protein PrsA